MSDQGPLPKQIAASIEDVKALLNDNRYLSIAFLSRRIQDVERDVRERFRTLDRSRDQRVAALEEAVQKLQERLRKAGMVCKILQNEVEQVKERLNSEKSRKALTHETDGRTEAQKTQEGIA